MRRRPGSSTRVGSKHPTGDATIPSAAGDEPIDELVVSDAEDEFGVVFKSFDERFVDIDVPEDGAHVIGGRHELELVVRRPAEIPDSEFVSKK